MSRLCKLLGVAGMVVLICTAFAVAGAERTTQVNVDRTANDAEAEVNYVTVGDRDDFVELSEDDVEWVALEASEAHGVLETREAINIKPVDIEPIDIDDVLCAISYPGNNIAFTTIAKGMRSGFGWCGDPPNGPPWELCAQVYPPPPLLCRLPSRPAFESVIYDKCVWEDFWNAHDYMGVEMPEVDFDQYVVVAVVLGERSLCTYEVNIASIKISKCGLVVRITECVRMEAMPFRVNPYHFVKFPRSCFGHGRKICFDHGAPILHEKVEKLPIKLEKEE